MNTKNKETEKQFAIHGVSCSASGSFLKRTYDKYFKIYKTPDAIIEFINKEKNKTDFLIINPPFRL